MSAQLWPEQRQVLTDADRWNAWAAQVNQRAIEQGIVDRETVEQNRRASQQARTDLLRRWTATR